MERLNTIWFASLGYLLSQPCLRRSMNAGTTAMTQYSVSRGQMNARFVWNECEGMSLDNYTCSGSVHRVLISI